MFFNISDDDLLNKNLFKLVDGWAGSGKSTQSVSNLTRLGEKFILTSFSNALKFAAQDKFGCPVDTICGAAFINTPYPRSSEKDIEEYDTIILDEILLDGVECINWIINHIGKINIIALTDSHQMLNAENSGAVLKAFEKLCKRKDTVYINIQETKRARNDETKQMYADLYALQSNQLFALSQVKEMFDCDIVDFKDVEFDEHNTYICHSNRIEHEVYKIYDIPSRRDINLIPKNHISRNRKVNLNKYPICDQITAETKHIDSYLQAGMIATPTRFQGKEVACGDKCYFIVEDTSVFTGREIYTVGTRCQDKKSLCIAMIHVEEYKDPKKIREIGVVQAQRLDIPDHDKSFHYVSINEMAKVIKQYGKPGVYYYPDIVTSGDNIIYTTLNMATLSQFADINEDNENYSVIYKKKVGGAKRTIGSIVKKDTTMHFDFMPKVYDIIKSDLNHPRINNPKNCKKTDFNKLCDIWSAFPSVLHNAPMPCAGLLYTEYDKDLLNFYKYKGSVVTKGSIITEELANRLGESEYVFSTGKQIGCELGHYTYNECKTSEEKKKKISQTPWGILYKNFYNRETVVLDGEIRTQYVKHNKNALELVACAIWSSLCCIMLDAIESLDIDEYLVVTDGLYYTSDEMPKIPEWCDFRIENKQMERILGKDEDKKYDHVEYKTYDDLPKEKELKRKRDREQKKSKRDNLSPEELEALRAKERERKRAARAKKKESAS